MCLSIIYIVVFLLQTGPCWGALLIAGEDVKSKEAANSFILDIKEMASAVHVVFGIRQVLIV